MATVGSQITSQEWQDAFARIAQVLGNGSGQTGYGQFIEEQSIRGNLSPNDELIGIEEWNGLIRNINRCSQHQSNTNQSNFTLTSGRIIGADVDAASATFTGDTYTLVGANTGRGVNDILDDITVIEANAALLASGQFTLTTERAFLESQRNSPWGGDGDPDDLIYCDLDVVFPGGYETTNSVGSADAGGDDHRRHFFNAGGDIRLSFNSSNLSVKDQNWATLLQGAGTVIFGKNSTTSTGSGLARDGATDVDGGGIDSAYGNYQLTTSFATIFRKYGSSVYAANYVQVQVRRVGTDTIRFRVQFFDNAEGNPNFDERVLLTSGSVMKAGIDLKRPSSATGNVNIPEPTSLVVTEFNNT
jgi:hypothetical protein